MKICGYVLLLFYFQIQVRGEIDEDQEERFYSPYWVVHLNGNHMADDIAKEMKFDYMGAIAGNQRVHRFRLNDEHTRQKRVAHHHTQRLLQHPKIEKAEQELLLERQKRDFLDFSEMAERALADDATDTKKRLIRDMEAKEVNQMFNDPFWEKEWYLHDTRSAIDEPKIDLHVIPVWRNKNITGKDVVVTVLDDGLLWTHPDLRANYDPKASFDLNGNDSDPLPRNTRKDMNKHGTRCAGEIAMVANNEICGVGIAYNAKIGGVRMLDGIVTDSTEASGFSFNIDHIDIFSASWGPTDNGRTMERPGPLALAALKRGVTKGRNGLGVIYVWASGNGGFVADDCSCDGYTSSIYTLAVSSVTMHDKAPRYGELCPSTMATTFSSGFRTTDRVVSTDLHNKCTDKHSGTSASAPSAAGILALLLEANPKLSWRDVQHLVAWTSEYAPLAKNEGWVKNAAGFLVNTRFGFGLMNADAIVTMANATTFKSVPKKAICRRTSPGGIRRRLAAGTITVVTMNSDGCVGTDNEVNYLEHVEISITLTYTRRGDLNISLISPNGMRTSLLKQRKADTSRSGIRDWPFMTVHNWGERSQGSWKLVVEDTSDSQTNRGALTKVELIMHGTKEMPHHMKQSKSHRRRYNLNYNSVKNVRSKMMERIKAALERMIDAKKMTKKFRRGKTWQSSAQKNPTD